MSHLKNAEVVERAHPLVIRDLGRFKQFLRDIGKYDEEEKHGIDI